MKSETTVPIRPGDFFGGIPQSISNAHVPDRNETVFSASFDKLRARLRNRWLRLYGERFWGPRELLTYVVLHRRISDSIQSGSPLSLGRLGGVEANVILWGKSIRGSLFRPDSWTFFSDTSSGATNAGIRPRNRESYRFFSKLAWDAMEALDLHGVWKTGFEAVCFKNASKKVFFDVEITGPDGKNQDHWLCALKGKQVLVVSPFPASIHRQILQLGKVWPRMRWMEGTKFVVEPFPYLIDEDCPETWWEVYDRIGKVVSRGEYDVALFGCGGLGLPFAHLAKKAGKVGMHLGGHLQLIFGIYGQRHLQQPWFRDQMNEYWVRPGANEVAKTANRVEGGCYW